jgi:hypothetical protein
VPGGAAPAADAGARAGDARAQRRKPRHRGGGRGGSAAAGDGAAPRAAAADPQLVINLAAQMERNLMEKNFGRAAQLFEAFLDKGRAAAAAAAPAAAAAAPAAPAGALAEAGAPGDAPAARAPAAGGGKAASAAAVLLPAPGYRPDRRCFSIYFIAIKNLFFNSGETRGLAAVQAAADLEAALHGGGPSRDALGALLCASRQWGARAGGGGGGGGGDWTRSRGGGSGFGGRRAGQEARRELQLFDQLRAAGGDVFFPFWKIAIQAALHEGQLDRAAG